VRIITAETWDGAASPTLVLVPGGIGDSTAFTEGRNDAQELAEQGFTVVVFDPDGRGQSEGEEDKNGHTHQDGLAEIIRSIAEFPSVDADRIGVLSYSYGITMASGTLARYPDLPVQFLIDWEGPANREDTTHGCIPGAPGAGSIEFMSDCDDEAFWSEREAQTFIAQISQYYQRVQSEQDHSQPDSSNAIDMINAAVEGGVPWVRLNDLPANQTYDETSLPPMLPESTDRHLASLMGEFAIEILALVP
jgi:pimeloyl-ACP methyl ester carboxylesterase